MPASVETSSAVFCAAEEHPITGALCGLLAAECTGDHAYDGKDAWTGEER